MSPRREVPVRYCNGGVGVHQRPCGKIATVVCAVHEGHSLLECDELRRRLFDGAWFACDNPEHQETGVATPIAAWFAERGLL